MLLSACREIKGKKRKKWDTNPPYQHQCQCPIYCSIWRAVNPDLDLLHDLLTSQIIYEIYVKVYGIFSMTSLYVALILDLLEMRGEDVFRAK